MRTPELENELFQFQQLEEQGVDVSVLICDCWECLKEALEEDDFGDPRACEPEWERNHRETEVLVYERPERRWPNALNPENAIPLDLQEKKP